VSGWKAGDDLPAVSLDLTLRRAVQAVAGTRDYYPVHHDAEAARAGGAEGIFFNTMFLQAFVGRALCQWFGNDAFPRSLTVRMGRPNYVGRTLTAKGNVIEVRPSDGHTNVDAEITLSTEDGLTTGVQATVELPS
jgi:acyl dehydratase